MKTVTTATTTAWQAADKGGANRAMMRATIQVPFTHDTIYDLDQIAGSFALHHQSGTGTMRSLYFFQKDTPRELTNIANLKWTRSVDQDAATCTITLWNTEPLPIGETPDADYDQDFDLPGYYTYNRGQDGLNTAYGQSPNSWKNILIPDRVIRTYEGWGFDATVAPENDAHMYPSGTWLIDDVVYNDDRTITVQCRDFARLLQDCMVIPPLIPWNQYPMVWTPFTPTKLPDTISSSFASSWVRPTYTGDSSQVYIGKGFTDGGRPYVNKDGSVFGHHGRQAFDTDPATYWLSVGNMPDWSSAYELVEGRTSSGTLRAVKVTPWAGPYTVYLSVYANGAWQGHEKVPYKARAVDAGTAIPFVHTFTVRRDTTTEMILPKAYSGVTKVRFTFHHLSDSGIGYFRWRAGAKDIQVLFSSTVLTTTPGATVTEGNFGDYTDIVKWFCAWGGLHWPASATWLNSDGSSTSYAPSTRDPVLPSGRAWGDFMDTGTKSITPLEVSIWDKKSFMDGISHVRDVIGFIFFVDERGGAVWRLPNTFSVGNYLWNVDGGPNAGRTSTVVTIRDDQVLLRSQPKISSRDLRDRIFVANLSGEFGAVSAGYNPGYFGIPKVGGWTDQHFASTAECQIMSDLVTLREAYTYRVNTVTIPGYPAIQVDDQVMIQEAVAGENYIHYVRAITSSWDATTGKWTYDLDTTWLGVSPTTQWWLDAATKASLAPETKAYLHTLGAI